MSFCSQNDLKTPHRGYHWDQVSPSYFEGWYFRLTLPEIKQTFAFMYSIEDPLGKQSNSGGAVQILGIDEAYLIRTFPNVQQFFANKDNLACGHWGKTNLTTKAKLLSPDQFRHGITEGYQATAQLNQGSIYDPVRNEYCLWEYQIKPIYGWGDSQQPQQSSAGWLSFLPIFEPGWQITMAHGLATGWVEWRGQQYQFTNAPAYSEKNWGNSFPEKWFWLNCNSFNQETDLAWGSWELQGKSMKYTVTLKGETNLPGTYVRTPTAKGLVFNCRDTTQGKLSLALYDYQGKTIVQANSNLAGLEVGSAL